MRVTSPVRTCPAAFTLQERGLGLLSWLAHTTRRTHPGCRGAVVSARSWTGCSTVLGSGRAARSSCAATPVSGNRPSCGTPSRPRPGSRSSVRPGSSRSGARLRGIAAVVQAVARRPGGFRFLNRRLSKRRSASFGHAADRFLVGLGVLGLLSDAARERPLLCVVDDAHWLDRVSAQVLAFVARRVEMESVALLFGTRGSSEKDDLATLPEIVLGGLSDADARLLLLSRITGRLDERILDRLVAEAQGNPWRCWSCRVG